MAKIDLTQLGNAFGKAYMRYYDNGDADDYQEMYDKGCKLLADPQMTPLLNDFARHRHDYITSDREVAAFAKAYTMCTKQVSPEADKIYHIPMDDHMAQLILTALMDKAHQQGISQETKQDYLTAYGDLKESMLNQ